MTDRELMQQALEALEFYACGDEIDEALITALRERLAQPNIFSEIVKDKTQRTHWEGCEEMHPECRKQRRDWVGLTVKEIVITAEACGGLASDFVVDVARAIEAKLKEKNT